MIRRSSICLATALLTVWSSVAFSETSRIELSDASQPVRLQVELEWGSIRIAGVSDANVVTVVSAPDQQDEIGGSLVALSESSNLVTVRQAPLESGSFRSANLEITVPAKVGGVLGPIADELHLKSRVFDGVVFGFDHVYDLRYICRAFFDNFDPKFLAKWLIIRIALRILI